MLKNVVDSVAVEKLKGIILDRYGRGLSIQYMQDASDIHRNDESMYLKGHDLYIPIQVHDHHFATVVIKETSHLSPEDKLTVAYMIRMVLEPEFYNWYLAQAANNAQNHKQTDNVVSIFTPHDLTQVMNEQISEEEKIRENLICLEARNPNTIPRLAYEVHEISQRWAFLKYNDIQDQVRSVEDLMSLGNLTLMIEDVLNLSPEHQQIIEHYLADKSISDRPLLVIGTGSHIESLEDQGMLKSTFAQMLKSHRLVADRLPRDNKLLQETLEFMLHI